MPLCIRRARKIITISHATAKDIVKYYNVLPENIAVIYVGFQDLRCCAKTAPAVDDCMKPYFFFTGRVKPRKNVHSVVSAFIRFKKRTHADCKLVIAGKSGGEYLESMMNELKKNEMEHEVFFVGFVSTELLCAYYLNAVAFVFPSLNEGFGMPVVEAMNLGTPVITSNISSLPEAAGNAGLLVDPYNVEDISRAMEKVFLEPEVRVKLVEKGYLQAQKFSWSKAAKEYMALLNAL